MWRSVVLLGALATIIKGQSTSVSPCLDYEGALPINTYIEGCITPPCLVPQLQDAVLNIIFRAPRTMVAMRTLATAYLAVGPVVIPINYDLGEHSVTCNFLENTYCPVLQDEVVMYRLSFYIESFFPAGSGATVEFRVEDQDNLPALCVRMIAQIAPPVSGSSGNVTHIGNEADAKL